MSSRGCGKALDSMCVKAAGAGADAKSEKERKMEVKVLYMLQLA